MDKIDRRSFLKLVGVVSASLLLAPFPEAKKTNLEWEQLGKAVMDRYAMGIRKDVKVGIDRTTGGDHTSICIYNVQTGERIWLNQADIRPTIRWWHMGGIS